tara:strand:+ start:1703 stop:2644 length:942 start_codon:yes stop_codon:yes gene_type:complete
LINFLYCFDKNYNKQALCSISALLKFSSNKINIYIIHEKPNSFGKYMKKIKDDPKLNRIEIYEFNKGNLDFPNIKDAHFSEATYYRLFIDDYIPKTIKSFVYIDPDAFFISKFEKSLSKEIEKLNSSDKVLSAFTVLGPDGNYANEFHLPPRKSGKYFNAGFLIFDYQKWRERNCGSDVVDILVNKKFDFKHCDQDILNFYFDGDYIQLSDKFNYDLNNLYAPPMKEDTKVIHYIGNNKPWSINGALNENSEYYINLFRDTFSKKYHIEETASLNSIKELLNNIVKLKFLNTDYPIRYILNCIASFLRISLSK